MAASAFAAAFFLFFALDVLVAYFFLLTVNRS
jgi:hypothetical protein